MSWRNFPNAWEYRISHLNAERDGLIRNLVKTQRTLFNLRVPRVIGDCFVYGNDLEEYRVLYAKQLRRIERLHLIETKLGLALTPVVL